ncbi:hypothetical protein [Actinomadura sp. DC4]|uniref:hypothetical protein n=1 Tax=Actinomadura sp. DC4 TaxID=3055069 RepID=UPI0025B22683|nr:hypothetical protein [Actinomadura sp. DC4]MDN3357850.1 hypothetical protein [Actinomadura sp. DC4]
MSPSRKRARLVAAGAVTALATTLIPAGSASAATLKGSWAPFTRCPVDDPAMLAADGVSATDTCLASHSSSGSIKLGTTTATTGATDLQAGVLSASTLSLVTPSGGALVADPVKIPGGLLGLMCPSKVPVITQICRSISDNTLNNVIATIQPAGTPSDFDLAAGLGSGDPIITLPVKIHLQNPFLASTCTIGSNSHPILLKPRNLAVPATDFARFDGDGTPDADNGDLLRIDTGGASQGDDSFAVPGATGCGGLGLLDAAVNLKTGLPSAAGNNKLVLNSPSTYLGGLYDPTSFAPGAGRRLAAFWHSAAKS